MTEDKQQVPDGLIWVIVGAAMPGVQHGDVVLVDPTRPEIAALMGALLFPTDPPAAAATGS